MLSPRVLREEGDVYLFLAKSSEIKIYIAIEVGPTDL